MYHIDFLINIITLFSGILTTIFGFMLYFKYKIKTIKHYSIFIFSTTFTVASTTIYYYFSNFENFQNNFSAKIFSVIIFQIFLFLISYYFSRFALGVLSKPFKTLNKVPLFIQLFIICISFAGNIFIFISKKYLYYDRINNLLFPLIILILLLSFIYYGARIFINLKNIKNPDLKKTLKLFALILLFFIPLQIFIVIVIKNPSAIFISRNIFYMTINFGSVILAAKYFFIETPKIYDKIVVRSNFITKYSITGREKEVVELIISGLSIKEIGVNLGISFKTANNHIHNIYKKTGVSSKIELLNLVKESLLG